MKLIHFAKFAGMCTVVMENGKFYQLPTVIDLDVERNKNKKDCLHLEQSTDRTESKVFRGKDFYELGKQLAKL